MLFPLILRLNAPIKHALHNCRIEIKLPTIDTDYLYIYLSIDIFITYLYNINLILVIV